jgi:hypothetical protein
VDSALDSLATTKSTIVPESKKKGMLFRHLANLYRLLLVGRLRRLLVISNELVLTTKRRRYHGDNDGDNESGDDAGDERQDASNNLINNKGPERHKTCFGSV